MRWNRRHTLGALMLVFGAAYYLLRDRGTQVEVLLATRGPMRVTIDEPSRTHLRTHEVVSAPSHGVVSASVRVGDRVSAGVAVATLGPVPLDARASEEAQAAAAAARAIHDEALARVRQAEIAVTEAKRELQRAERLATEGGIAAKAVDDARAAVQLREREVEAARSRERATAQEERRALAAAFAGIRTQPLTLRAPLSGHVLRVFEEHARVVPAGTPILEIGDPGSVEFTMEILSADALDVRQGQHVLIVSSHGDTLLAAVDRVDPAAFTKTSALGIPEQRVKVTARATGAVPPLGDGYELPAAVVVWEDSAAIALPASAVRSGDAPDAWHVLLVRDARLHQAPVKLGRRNSTHVEILSGVSPGDTVVSLPIETLKDGQRVIVGRRNR